MILTDFYKLSHNVEGIKSKTRYNCTTSTGEYEPFELMRDRARDGVFFLYFGENPDTFKQIDPRRNAGISVRNGRNISSVFIPNPKDEPFKGYGDTRGTSDALLFLFNTDYTEIEIFVARGQKLNKTNLWLSFIDGELDDEMEVLRRRAESRQTAKEYLQ